MTKNHKSSIIKYKEKGKEMRTIINLRNVDHIEIEKTDILPYSTRGVPRRGEPYFVVRFNFNKNHTITQNVQNSDTIEQLENAIRDGENYFEI